MFSPQPPSASLCRQQTFDLRDRMMSEILGHLGDDLGFGFLCKLTPEIAENFRRRPPSLQSPNRPTPPAKKKWRRLFGEGARGNE
jgi:hypothetical protein